MAKYCTQCGAALQEDDVFCCQCGTLVEGKTPPPNAWSKVSADLAAAPPVKKRGCLTAILIFLLVVAALLAAAYFLFLRDFLSIGNVVDKEFGDSDDTGSGFSISLDELLGSSKDEPDQDKSAASTQTPSEAQRDEPDAQTPQPSEAVRVNPFNDVSEDSYYYDAVLWCAEKGVVGGDSFRPADPCTRAQVMTMLWRLAGSPDMSGSTPVFADAPEDAWFFQAVQWASGAGLISATPGSECRPDDNVTRAQMVMFLYRMVGYESGRSNPFTDVNEDDWFRDPAVWALDAGIIGASDTFRPNDACDRGNVATFLYRALA